ncbi:MAG: hypothetical protein M3494_03725 [Actinomycetota bacterium]|nr:hypothetical protein [Actinomycetota bacterium]
MRTNGQRVGHILEDRMPSLRAADISALCARHRVYRKPSGVPITQSLAEELRGRLRWWSHGAFREKSALHGAQYLAGRRAPPIS